MGTDANKSTTQDPSVPGKRTQFMLWNGDPAINTTILHSQNHSLSSKPKITQAIDGKAWTQPTSPASWPQAPLPHR